MQDSSQEDEAELLPRTSLLLPRTSPLPPRTSPLPPSRISPLSPRTSLLLTLASRRLPAPAYSDLLNLPVPTSWLRELPIPTYWLLELTIPTT